MVRDIFLKKATSEQRLKEEGIMQIFGVRLFQAEGVEHGKAPR